jgi:hypothetical protein
MMGTSEGLIGNNSAPWKSPELIQRFLETWFLAARAWARLTGKTDRGGLLAHHDRLALWEWRVLVGILLNLRRLRLRQ